MTVTVEKRHVWQQSVGWAVIWPVPLALALMGHFFAYPKVLFQGNILLMNARTQRALEIWWFVSEHHLWFFVIYASLLVAAFLVLRLRHSAIWIIAIVFVTLALPGFWYFTKMSYLAGKLISFAR